jgi:hypothetical protein
LHLLDDGRHASASTRIGQLKQVNESSTTKAAQLKQHDECSSSRRKQLHVSQGGIMPAKPAETKASMQHKYKINTLSISYSFSKSHWREMKSGVSYHSLASQ